MSLGILVNNSLGVPILSSDAISLIPVDIRVIPPQPYDPSAGPEPLFLWDYSTWTTQGYRLTAILGLSPSWPYMGVAYVDIVNSVLTPDVAGKYVRVSYNSVAGLALNYPEMRLYIFITDIW